jgi:hypothetical protein
MLIRIIIRHCDTTFEWLSDCRLTPSEQFSSHIMARTINISMKLYPLCNRQTRLHGLFLCYITETTTRKQYVDPLGHTILITSQSIFPQWRVLAEEQQIPIYSLRVPNQPSTTFESSTLPLTPPIRLRRTWGKSVHIMYRNK